MDELSCVPLARFKLVKGWWGSTIVRCVLQAHSQPLSVHLLTRPALCVIVESTYLRQELQQREHAYIVVLERFKLEWVCQILKIVHSVVLAHTRQVKESLQRTSALFVSQVHIRLVRGWLGIQIVYSVYLGMSALRDCLLCALLAPIKVGQVWSVLRAACHVQLENTYWAQVQAKRMIAFFAKPDHIPLALGLKMQAVLSVYSVHSRLAMEWLVLVTVPFALLESFNQVMPQQIVPHVHTALSKLEMEWTQ
jgi:hypothetical protein